MHFLIAVVSTISYSSSLAYSWQFSCNLFFFLSRRLLYCSTNTVYICGNCRVETESSNFSHKENSAITQYASQSLQTNVNLMWQKELQTNSHIWAEQNSHYSWSVTNSGGKRLKHYFSVKSICDGDFWLPNIRSN